MTFSSRRFMIFAMLRCFLLLLLSVSTLSRADEPPKVSIPELLKPASRLHAFQQFCLRASAAEAKRSNWDDLEEFASWHRCLEVIRIERPNDAPRYLVTTRGYLGDSLEALESTAPQELRPTILLPREKLDFWLFAEDGTQIPARKDFLFDGLVADLDGDGELDFAEKRHASTEGHATDFVVIKPPDADAAPTFAVLYNFHAQEFAPTNSWGFDFASTPDGKAYGLRLGPLTAEGIEPEVAFHWDAPQRKWIGPRGEPGAHFRVLEGDPDAALERIRRGGGLGYELNPAPKPVAAAEEVPDRWEFDAISPDPLSKPYRYRSLAGLSHAQLFDAMTRRRTVWDFVADRQRETTRFDDLWALEPQAAALAYVARNRPPALAARTLLGFAQTTDKPPEEGSVVLDDGPSGCFAPSGAYVHHLLCARDGSFLMRAEIIQPWFPLAPARRRIYCDFRKLDLPYEDARRVLQTVWWMSRVRATKLSTETSEFMSGGSTSDGYASVQVIAARAGFSMAASRSADHVGTWLGVGTMSADYDQSAFMNLVVQLFNRDLPARLGEAWKRLAPDEPWYLRDETASSEPTPAEIAKTKTDATEVLQLFARGRLSTAAVIPAVKIPGEMGWRDLRETLAKIRVELPPPCATEQRLGALDAELKGWVDKLGSEGTSTRARTQRQMARQRADGASGTTLSIPGLAPPGSEPKTAPPPEDTKFEAFDALHEKRAGIRYSAPPADQQLIELREALALALLQIDLFNDAGALHRQAIDDPFFGKFACHRLAKIDPPRAADLLRRMEAATDNEMERSALAQARKELEGNAAPGTPESRATLLATLRNPRGDWSARTHALQALIPIANPAASADAELDAALLDAIRAAGQSREQLPGGIVEAAALRAGAAAWEPLLQLAKGGPQDGLGRLREVVAGLAMIAQRQPEPFREKLREVLAPQFQETHGSLDDVFWSAWQADVRALKLELEHAATSGPDDAEGTRARGGSSRTDPVIHRFHLARQVAALWNEEDALTSARMLVAFSLGHAKRFAANYDTGFERLREQLTGAVARLDPAQRRELDDFLAWCDREARIKLREEQSHAATKTMLTRLRGVLAPVATQ